MSQIGKLYSYYLKKVFRKNWIRITLVTLFMGFVWFGLPYLGFKTLKNSELSVGVHEDDYKKLSSEEKTKLKELALTKTKADLTFQEFNHLLIEGIEPLRRVNRKELEKRIKELEEKKESGTEEELRKLKGEISERESQDKGQTKYGITSDYNANNSFFYCRTSDYWEGNNKWRLLNDISWWNLTGFFVTFFLIFNIFDSTFFHPQQDGEEATVLTLTPGIKRSDLVWSKTLAFLTFYSIANVLLFLLPYGFYYFWAGTQTSVGAFFLLTLWTCLVGPILFFGLILAPYLWATSWVRWLGWIVSSLVAFFPQLWLFGKQIAYPHASWPYKVEKHFFNPLVFIPVSLVVGILFLVLYYWHYQEQDLS